MAGPARTLQSSPAVPLPSLKKSMSSSGKNQKTILGFFQKRSVDPRHTVETLPQATGSPLLPSKAGKSSLAKKPLRGSSQSLTPAPSSDVLDDDDIPLESDPSPLMRDGMTGLPSPKSANGTINGDGQATVTLGFYSPSRKVSSYVLWILYVSSLPMCQ